jgi:hypothetical protein
MQLELVRFPSGARPTRKRHSGAPP